jgi:hypothetical protein
MYPNSVTRVRQYLRCWLLIVATMLLLAANPRQAMADDVIIMTTSTLNDFSVSSSHIVNVNFDAGFIHTAEIPFGMVLTQLLVNDVVVAEQAYHYVFSMDSLFPDWLHIDWQYQLPATGTYEIKFRCIPDGQAQGPLVDLVLYHTVP